MSSHITHECPILKAKPNAFNYSCCLGVLNFILNGFMNPALGHNKILTLSIVKILQFHTIAHLVSYI